MQMVPLGVLCRTNSPTTAASFERGKNHFGGVNQELFIFKKGDEGA